jgi:hypothetical protein
MNDPKIDPHSSSNTDAEQASHNLEHADQPKAINPDQPPERDPGEADFAAEAHGFTGFESAGKGADYKSDKSSPNKNKLIGLIKLLTNNLQLSKLGNFYK